MSAIPAALSIILGIILGTVALAAGIFILVKLFGLVWMILTAVFTFIGREVSDLVRLIGSVVLAVVFIPLVVLNVVIGRWSASAHYGRAFSGELSAAGQCIYRLLIGNPARLIGLGGAVEGIEQRLPAAIADAPGADKPSKRAGMFEGYKITGSLPGGGSGGKLYVAEPDDMKRAALERRGAGNVDQVVIKVFSQREGSTLDQIVRESRALEAAKELGLVLEHKSEAERFFYVMRYVPGDSLAAVTQRLHAESPSGGLGDKQLTLALTYAGDLLSSLDTYHRGGLWHKDVKPDNIIVDAGEGGRAHLVDFGLVTPMRSAMTLTTHGTEYFRDPELVRQALRGVKVHQIDGAKFDVYSAGAVLYSVIENSFPAHGGLSRVSKRCPEALRWIVRRSMAEYDNRYPTARAMLDDLRAVAASADPFTMRPADLPSMRGGGAVVEEPVEEQTPLTPMAPTAPAAVAAAGTPVPPPAQPTGPARRMAPKITLADWWSGRYNASGAAAAPAAPMPPRPAVPAAPMPPAAPRPGRVPPGERRPADEQLRNARERARVRRDRAMERLGGRRVAAVRRDRRAKNHASGMNLGVAVALFLFLGACVGLAGLVVGLAGSRQASAPMVQIEQYPEGHASVGTAMTIDLPVDASVLMLSDLDTPLDPKVQDWLTAGLMVMEQAGVRFAGELPTNIADDPETLELLAVARATRGQAPIDDSDFDDRVRLALGAFQQAGAEAPDAILWVAPEPGVPGSVRYVLVSADSTTTGSADAMAPQVIVDHLRAATKGL